MLQMVLQAGLHCTLLALVLLPRAHLAVMMTPTVPLNRPLLQSLAVPRDRPYLISLVPLVEAAAPLQA